MEKGRRKIRICLLGIVLTAVVIGVFYYYYGGSNTGISSEGTLVQATEEGHHVC